MHLQHMHEGEDGNVVIIIESPPDQQPTNGKYNPSKQDTLVNVTTTTPLDNITVALYRKLFSELSADGKAMFMDIISRYDMALNKLRGCSGKIYLLRKREFVITGATIFKIGRTGRSIKQRMEGYPAGSVLLKCINVCNQYAAEVDVIREFDEKFVCRRDIGREYYEGDQQKMAEHLTMICSRYEPIRDNKYKYITDPKLLSVIDSEEDEKDEDDDDENVDSDNSYYDDIDLINSDNDEDMVAAINKTVH